MTEADQFYEQFTKKQNSLNNRRNRGIGLEVCKKFYEKGCNIILLGRDEKLLSELSREFNSIFYCCDFNNLDEVENISKKISMDNHIDILINSAGIFEVNSLEETSLQSLKEMFNVNFYTILTYKKFN